MPKAIFVLQVSTLMLCMATLATTTVAWFSSADTLHFSKIDISLSEQGDRFLIGARGSNGEWVPAGDGHNVDDEDLKSVFPTYNPENPFNPVTSASDGIAVGYYETPGEATYGKYDYRSFLDHHSYNPAYLPSYYKFHGEADDKKDYYQFEFLFKSNVTGYLLLHPESAVTPSERNKKVVEDHPGTDIEDLKKAVNTIRVSFYSDYGYSIFDPHKRNLDGSRKEVKQAGRLNIYGGDPYFDDDNDPVNPHEVVYGTYRPGVEDDLIFSSDAIETDRDNGFENIDKDNCFEAYSRAGVASFMDEEQSADYVPRMEESLSIDDYAKDTDTMASIARREKLALANLKAGECTRLVVTIYCEGWDHSMINSIGLAAFDVRLAFTAYGQYEAPEETSEDPLP